MFVSLRCPFNWLLHTVLDRFEQPTHMRWVVAHAKLLVDEHCHALGRPDGSCKAMGLCPLLEQPGKLLHLLWRQTGCWPSRNFPTLDGGATLSNLLAVRLFVSSFHCITL